MLVAVDETDSSVKFSNLYANEHDSPGFVHLLALGHYNFVETEERNQLPMPGLPPGLGPVPIDLSKVDGGDITTKEWTRTGDRIEVVCDRPEGSRRQRPPAGTYAEDPLTPRPRRLSSSNLPFRPPSVSSGRVRLLPPFSTGATAKAGVSTGHAGRTAVPRTAAS